MRIIFAGTPQFAAEALQALIAKDREVVLVLTQPDRAAGRGLRTQASPVKQCAIKSGLRVFQPPHLRGTDVHEVLRAVAPDVIVVAAYGLLLPRAVLEIPGRGCLNIHASLLPRWRGAAPIQRAILAGDRETGISIMAMDEGLDTGAVLLQEKTPILETDTAASLHDRLAAIGARCIERALNEWPVPCAQDPTGATYAAKITKDESAIDWRQSAARIALRVRAFNPYPGASTMFQEDPLKIWQAIAVHNGRGDDVGRILGIDPQGIKVACGEGALVIGELQLAGGKRMKATAFAQGHPALVGMRLGDRV